MGVTRLDVARRAGVSTAVVSYVVNNGPRAVSAKSRDAVERAIRELNYRPNIMARALKGGVSGSVGLLVPSQVNPYFAELTEAIERELSARETLVLVGVAGRASDRFQRYVQLFRDRRVDGIIVVGDHGVEPSIEGMESAIPVVYVDRQGGASDVPSVSTDGYGAARRAVEHLQGHGHTVIGCIAGPPGLTVSGRRVDGWRDQVLTQQHEVNDDLLAYGDFTSSGGEDAATSLLSPEGRRAAARIERPTALLVSSDIQAMGVIHACDRLGLRVPEDVAVVSFDGTRAGAFTHPPLTSMRQPVDGMARELVASLNQVEPRSVELDCNLVVRRSCGCETA